MTTNFISEALTATFQAKYPHADVYYDFPGAVFVYFADGRLLVIGDTNETWTADIYETEQDFADGYAPVCIDTDIPTEIEDADAIVDAVDRQL